MAGLEIDREDIHNMKKWRKNVMKRISNSIGKWANINNIMQYPVIRGSTVSIYLFDIILELFNYPNRPALPYDAKINLFYMHFPHG